MPTIKVYYEPAPKNFPRLPYLAEYSKTLFFGNRPTITVTGRGLTPKTAKRKARRYMFIAESRLKQLKEKS